jgi:CheY-like chemotaxis protein
MALVLVADDDATIAGMMQLILEDDGHEVLLVGDGVEALAAIRRHRPDLAVLDHQMPNLAGGDVARLIGADPKLAGTPVMMITAYGTELRGELNVLDPAAGPSPVELLINKPFQPEQLSRGAASILARAAARPAAPCRGADVGRAHPAALAQLAGGPAEGDAQALVRTRLELARFRVGLVGVDEQLRRERRA